MRARIIFILPLLVSPPLGNPANKRCPSHSGMRPAGQLFAFEHCFASVYGGMVPLLQFTVEQCCEWPTLSVFESVGLLTFPRLLALPSFIKSFRSSAPAF